MVAPSPFTRTPFARERLTNSVCKAIGDSQDYAMQLQNSCLGLRNVEFDSPKCGVHNERFFTLSDCNAVIVNSQMEDSVGSIVMARAKFQSCSFKRIMTVDDPGQLTQGLVARQDYQAVFCTTDSSEEINQILQQAGENELLVSESLRPRFHELEHVPRCHDLEVLAALPPRRYEVVLRVGAGASVKCAARDIQRTHKGVDGQLFRAMRVLHASTRLELCRLLIRVGLLIP